MGDLADRVINCPGSDRTLVPVALRADGTTAQLLFPSDLTNAEAEKIARVILAYATGGAHVG